MELNKALVVCGLVMMMFLGVLAHHEGDREHSAEIQREITWMESHQVIVPRQ